MGLPLPAQASARYFPRSSGDLHLWVDAPVLDHGLTPPPGHGVTVGVVLLQPGSRGHVRLASDDPADPPVIDPGYLTAETDLPRLVAGLRTATEILAADALRPYVGAPMAPWTGDTDDDSLARFVRGHAETLYHPVGTCRMGTDDGSVVDTELRVRGLAGLRVVDASVLPMINRGYTLAPTIMIAERAADLIGTSTADRDARSGGSI